MVKIKYLIGLFLTICGGVLMAQSTDYEYLKSDEVRVEVPHFFVEGIPAEGVVYCDSPEKLFRNGYVKEAYVNGESRELNFKNGKAEFQLTFDRREPLSFKLDGFTFVKDVNPMPLWVGVIPVFIVILLALIFKEVVSSLIVGIVTGASIIAYYADSASAWEGILRLIDTYVIESITDSDHVSVLVFSILIGGIVALISKNGGMKAVVNIISKKANSPRSGQMATWALGLAIFFDDYANTLVVGNTMRPLTDKLRISREKLSYIVDSTAAPVAAIAFITTWIGAELGYIQGALDQINSAGIVIDQGAYSIFFASLEFAFYPLLCLIFMFFIIYLKRDYGSMYGAEVAARAGKITEGKIDTGLTEDEFEPAKNTRLRFANAFIPIFIVITGTFIGLLVTGDYWEVAKDDSMSFGTQLAVAVGNSDSYRSLLWASMLGIMAAIVLTVSQRILSLTEAIETSFNGFKTMMGAVVILILAWSLAAITAEMHTADFLASLARGNVAPWLIPAITFVIAAVVAFSTGSSWGTMAILYPLMLPLSWELSIQAQIEPEMAVALFANVTSCVLAGAVLGDHCSPISDTTILSSLATQCDHISHVRTQLPYALTVGLVSVILTVLSAVTPISGFLLLAVGAMLLFAVVRFFGKKLPS